LLYEFLYWALGVLMTFTHGLRIVGRTRIPQSGPALLIGNHTSYLDIILGGLACRRRVYFLARQTLTRNRALAFIMRFFGTMLIDQEGFSRAGLQGVMDALAKNKVVLVYPEGERCRDGELARFKPGITLLLRKLQAPVVPIGLAGVFETWPRHQRFPSLAPVFLDWAPARIAVCVGDPIQPNAFQNLSRDEMLDLLNNKVRNCVDEAERIRNAANHG
jgi:1-acyl-sn-glycerol-3-phosphate acyltransferase